jgi:hypothetical protein
MKMSNKSLVEIIPNNDDVVLYVRLNPADATPAFSMLNVDEMQPNIC